MSKISRNDQTGNDFEQLSVAEDVPQAVGSTGSVDYEQFRVDGSPILPTIVATLTILITKPRPQWLIRCHPDRLWRFIAWVLRDGSDFYIVHPDLMAAVVGLAHRMILIPTITSRGKLFFWPIRLPNDKGRLDEWNTTALKAAEKAISTWLRIAANEQVGDYTVTCVADKVDEPAWPDLTFDQMQELAFPSRIITSLQHPVIQELFEDEGKRQR